MKQISMKMYDENIECDSFAIEILFPCYGKYGKLYKFWILL